MTSMIDMESHVALSVNGNESKTDFHHPYTPYAIQEQFMQTVYDVLSRGSGGVGILESPTGTGKSLSLICASLTWLRDFKKQQYEERLEGGEDGGNEPEWVLEAARARKRREMLRQREDLEARLKRVRVKEKAQREMFLKGEQLVKRRKVVSNEKSSVVHGDDEFGLDEYESDEEGGIKASKGGMAEGVQLSAETMALMEKLGMNTGPPKEEEEEPDDEIKIFYCSRTHSQLTQFINELRRVKIPQIIPPESSTRDGVEIEEFKHLTLGSRKNLCINPAVLKLRSAAAINDRCQELQQPSSLKENKCPFIPNKENQPLVNDFRDHSLASLRDIEELGELGKQIGICPYYASRSAIRPSEIITLPYPLLLQGSAREALGINLKGHVVIIDEAHNLMDAISGIYGISVTLAQLKRSRAQLGLYLQKFRNRLQGKNRVYVAQVVRLLDSLAGYLEGKTKSKQFDGAVEPSELLAGRGVDQINLYKLLKYLQESKLARKVEGYIQNEEQEAMSSNDKMKSKLNSSSDSTTPTLRHIQSLLAALTNPSKEGHLHYTFDPSTSTTTLKYLLLDPTHHFRAVVSSARAVLLAGGTMSPMADYTTHLLSYLPPSSITTLSCGHVIPKENLLAWTLARGPTGTEFEFTHSKRQGRAGEEMLDELGRTMLNLCTVVPDGVVVFFPSYAFLDTVVARWQRPSGNVHGGLNVWDRLAKKKQLFRENKGPKAEGEEDLLTSYAKAIDAGRGGLLFSVVGGKLSEGINFSDALGRLVVIVGLPFPNILSGEWKAKLAYIENVTEERLERDGVGENERKTRGKEAAREFVENACMRAVNQSVGRAIRHRGDWAGIVMIDGRYGSERIRAKLPGWIREGVQGGKKEGDFAGLMGCLSSFFRGKKIG